MALSGALRVGPAGWSYADWEGVVYPRRKPRGFHPLAFLSRFVDCVEVNSSFYGVPRREHAERWAERVAERPGFRFTAKLQNVFTHEELPEADRELFALARPFLAGIEPLLRAGRLACLLVQFPLSFRKDGPALRRLERIHAHFGHLPLVVEVRHRSWYEPDALRWLERGGFSLARIDLPPARDHPPADAPALGPVGYVRLHGRNASTWFRAGAGRDQRYDYLYGQDELAQVARVARRIATGRDETFVITNNHFGGQAVANALELLALLGDEPPPAPPELARAFPGLAGRVRLTGQPDLFG